ncbi:unnamed protein product, partial [Allacma fusca]
FERLEMIWETMETYPPELL